MIVKPVKKYIGLKIIFEYLPPEPKPAKNINSPTIHMSENNIWRKLNFIFSFIIKKAEKKSPLLIYAFKFNCNSNSSSCSFAIAAGASIITSRPELFLGKAI